MSGCLDKLRKSPPIKSSFFWSLPSCDLVRVFTGDGLAGTGIAEAGVTGACLSVTIVNSETLFPTPTCVDEAGDD